MLLCLKFQNVASLGQDLKRERELRSISLKEISSSTKISLRFLQALEEDRLDILPGSFFIKAILKAYAKSIGLEEDYVLNKYYESSLEQEQSLESKQIKRKTRPAVTRNIKKLIYSVALTIIILLFLFSLYYLFFLKKQTFPLPPVSKGLTHLQGETELPPSRTGPLAEFMPEEENLTIEISFLEETWIQVWADGVVKVDGLKQPGEKLVVEASEELLINLGNAGGISYKLKNKQGKQLGPSGAVIRNLRITLENYERFLTQGKDTIVDLES
jgi:transcriptional regulator with XRE-family HTH domain